MERTFALYSPIIGSIKVIRSGKVKRAKLYYLRDRSGKSARISEKIKKRIGVDILEPVNQEIGLTESKSEAQPQKEGIKVEKKDKTILPKKKEEVKIEKK